jgi:hypothetical protein
MQIEREEFNAWMQLLRGDIAGVHDRLDKLNGRTRANEADIAVLQATQAGPSRDTAARWTALGSGVGAVLAGALAWFTK